MNYILATASLTVAAAAAAEATGVYDTRALAKTGKKTKQGAKASTSKSSKSKSCKSKSKSSKSISKSSKRDFDDVLEEYDQFEGMMTSKMGLPNILDPMVQSFLSQTKGPFASEEEATVACSTRCNEHIKPCCNESEECGEECTTFEVARLYQVNGTDYYQCQLVNNNANQFNTRRISPALPDLSYDGDVSVTRSTYNGKSAPPLLTVVRPQGLSASFPVVAPTEDWVNLVLPAISCIAVNGGDPQACTDCFFGASSVAGDSCAALAAGICGFERNLGDDPTPFFTDEAGGCGIPCFAGEASDFACLASLQTFALGVFGQDMIDVPGLGPSFGCTSQHIADPLTGDPLPDYTCPPNTNQPVPGEN